MSFMHKQALNVDIAPNPLEELSRALKSDMTNVNSLILRSMQSEVPLIPQLAQYLIAAGGKRIRPLLTLAAARMFGGDMAKTYYLAAAVEFIHTATLLHDDVVDESQERRGQKSANLVFGNQASVLVGDFLFSKSFQLMVEAGSLDVLRILSDAAAIIAKGEVLQLSTTNDIQTDIPAYMQVIESKTAALFAAACEVGPVIAGASAEASTALRNYGMQIGIAFQIVDDILDYSADQKILGKELGDDFREGKMTAPVILALEKSNEEERSFWKRTLGEKSQFPGDFETACAIIKKYNSIEGAKTLARQYALNAQQSLSPLKDKAYSETLHDLADYTVSRHF